MRVELKDLQDMLVVAEGADQLEMRESRERE